MFFGYYHKTTIQKALDKDEQDRRKQLKANLKPEITALMSELLLNNYKATGIIESDFSLIYTFASSQKTVWLQTSRETGDLMKTLVAVNCRNAELLADKLINEKTANLDKANSGLKILLEARLLLEQNSFDKDAILNLLQQADFIIRENIMEFKL